jgi:hypothetical protein
LHLTEIETENVLTCDRLSTELIWYNVYGFRCFFELRRQLEDNWQLYGSQLVVVDKFYPNSKTCSQCGALKEFLSLSERVLHCHTCQARI